MSTNAIGQIFSCNHVTVLSYLRKYNIPRRTKLGSRKAIEISREELSRLYVAERLSQKQIAKKIGHSVYGVERWMKIYGIKGRTYYESHEVREKHDFSGDLKEKAYLIGFRLGDLNVYRVRKLIQVRCSTTIQAQVDLIKSLFEKYGYVHVWKARRGTFEIIVLLNESFNFLLPKHDSIEDWVLDDRNLFLSFLAGYSDAEGCILIRKSNHGNYRLFAGFELATYDRTLLTQVSEKLKEFGLIFPSVYLAKKAGVDSKGNRWNKDCWRISIYQKSSLWKLLNRLEPLMKHDEKLKAITRAKENIVSRNNLPYCRPFDLRLT